MYDTSKSICPGTRLRQKRTLPPGCNYVLTHLDQHHGSSGSCFRSLTCLTPGCLRRGADGDRHPGRWGKRETVPNTTLSPSEVGTGGDQDPRRMAGGLYLTLHCHQQNDFGIQMGSSESYFNGSLSVGCRTEPGEATRGVEPMSSVFPAAYVHRNV